MGWRRGPRSRWTRSACCGSSWQGLTLAHFTAQFEPCLTQENTLHTLNTLSNLKTPLTRATQPLRASPIPYKALKLS